MVHALEKAASCLNRGGVILEVHDLVDPPRIEVHSDGAEPSGLRRSGQAFISRKIPMEK
jgi:hypothetical protein